MHEPDVTKIEDIIKEREESHSFYSGNSQVYRAFLQMEEATFVDGELLKGQKELIAIGIAIVINCESCLEWHIKQALNAGITKEQILEAVGVGIEMGGGPATVSARFAMKVLSYYTKAYHL
ncbi:MAG: carboxymuconolactone decarboxylase family protein [Peptococcaceae bacterium]|nr:carboxymuconolactone decarboxylase family protein [Peptococcaceae bacterium]